MSFKDLKFPSKEEAAEPMHSPEFLRKRKAFMIMPIFGLLFLALAFISMGGGTSTGDKQQSASQGFNTELPGARFDKKKPASNKLEFYKQADQDSLKRKEFLRQDPNYHRMGDSPILEDPRQGELQKKLDQLKEAINQPVIHYPEPVAPKITSYTPSLPLGPRHIQPPSDEPEPTGTTTTDPELEKLNGMLDKIIKIQHPEKTALEAEAKAWGTADTLSGADTVANSLPAVVQEDQILTAGATIALRLTELSKINGISFPKDQLAYGVVSINNDRMLITVNSIRRGQSIYSTALQVFDMDGLPGIHIPGDLGRETAKQSVDQSINSMGLMNLDASPAAQVTNAGVLAAKSLLTRKVRLVRVAVRAGYQVLLRSTKAKIQIANTQHAADSVIIAPEPGTFIPFLHRTIRHEKMELTLQGVYLRDSLLWLSLRLENHSPIGYKPEYIRWCIRDRKQQRRTAIQELPLKPMYVSPVEVLAGDSSRILLAAFRPFAIPHDKELVLQLAEGNGARELVMEIRGKQLLKAKNYDTP
ncbi:conjugative transposon protein TraM [Flavitalea sp. BT771]|uniref:conjugative transposon protein TraM n=1 Tax=Flavitalea sp. BT771 TaxID=3063329 RepID=UPI0026E2C771|nr:conjugative transposon protein TraM [Flavitalea sp. BT771]MDO6433051.1 conjugative transposon protein TraM [Flavitalea sp. BT771]MDV6221673.1 conjugative transposon protein TraM [Flavitalea sp. BT771]